MEHEERILKNRPNKSGERVELRIETTHISGVPNNILQQPAKDLLKQK